MNATLSPATGLWVKQLVKYRRPGCASGYSGVSGEKGP